MRAFFIFAFFLFSVICSVFFGAEKAYAWGVLNSTPAKTINDSLVQNLSCHKLNVNSIYRAIRDDAFNERRNIPLQNWGFNSGGASIAGCWALSSTQRMFSYLARYNEPSAQSSPERTEHVLNMVRRSKPDILSMEAWTAHNPVLKEWPYQQQAVFLLKEDALVDSKIFKFQGLWADIIAGYNQRIEWTNVHRNFVNDIQVNQAYRFFRFGNIPMGIGSGARSREENLNTIQQLTLNLAGKRLTLINLRLRQTSQHVVMAKSYKVDSDGNVRIKVYDSNQWKSDHEILYNTRDQQFYAPDIFGSKGGKRPLGAFIVSEGERGPLESAMLKYYRQACK